MINYTHVRAKVDIYSHNRDIVCFAGELYPITFIDIDNRLYHVACEPEIGTYATTIALEPYDPDFYFIEAGMVEEIIEEEYFMDEEW